MCCVRRAAVCWAAVSFFLASHLWAQCSGVLCYSVSRSLLPEPSSEGSICLYEKSYCFLVDFNLRVTVTRFLQTYTVTDEGESCVDWAASAVCSSKHLSACLNAGLCLRRSVLTVLLGFEFSEIPG